MLMYLLTLDAICYAFGLRCAMYLLTRTQFVDADSEVDVLLLILAHLLTLTQMR